MLSDRLNPVKMIKRRMLACPICGGSADMALLRGHCTSWMDINGKHHTLFMQKNKYKWERYKDLICKSCGCEWDTGWYPADDTMFQVDVRKDRVDFGEAYRELTKGILPQPLSSVDLQELEDRFGEEVRFVVEDMMYCRNRRFAQKNDST